MSGDLAREEAERRWPQLVELEGHRLVFVAGAAWQATQPPTDAEVEAAARAEFIAAWEDDAALWDAYPADHPVKVAARRQTRAGLAALTAAREVR